MFQFKICTNRIGLGVLRQDPKEGAYNGPGMDQAEHKWNPEQRLLSLSVNVFVTFIV